MSLGILGVTHCAEYMRPFKIGEDSGICSDCQKTNEDKAQKETIEKRVRQEVAEALEEIETIIVRIDGIEIKIQGYWKDNKFYYIGEEK